VQRCGLRGAEGGSDRRRLQPLDPPLPLKLQA